MHIFLFIKSENHFRLCPSNGKLIWLFATNSHRLFIPKNNLSKINGKILHRRKKRNVIVCLLKSHSIKPFYLSPKLTSHYTLKDGIRPLPWTEPKKRRYTEKKKKKKTEKNKKNKKRKHIHCASNSVNFLF